MHGEPAAPGSFHGRRKGKALRRGQERLVEEVLPRLRLPRRELDRPLSSLFPERHFVAGAPFSLYATLTLYL